MAQVNPVVGYPNNYLSVSTGWANELLTNQAYGAGFPNASSFGTTSVTYDTTPGPTLGTLQSSTVTFSQFAASGDPSGPGSVTNSGLMQFTPAVNCNYSFSGKLLMVFTRSFTSAGATGTMTLEEIGGPVLTSYGTSLIGIPNTGGVLFDAAVPTTGLQSGALTAGVAYRWTWSFNTQLISNGDTGARATLAPNPNVLTGFGLTFNAVPTPGAAILLGLGGALASRRRR